MFAQIFTQRPFTSTTNIVGEGKWDFICHIRMLLVLYHPCMTGFIQIIYPIGDMGVVATPLWPSVGVKPNTSKVGDLESSGTLECLEFNSKAQTTRIEAFLVSLERSWNVDIENGLALAIRKSAAQVMGKRRAGSQTGTKSQESTSS